MTTEETTTTESTGTDTKKRVCGVCGKQGHNKRSCPERKKAEAAASLDSPKKGMPKKKAGAKKRGRPAGSTTTMAPSLIVTGPISPLTDFEEVSKQSTVNGKTIVCKLRDYPEAQHTQVAVSILEGDKAVGSLGLMPVDVATKLYTLLGGILQQYGRARNAVPSPLNRTNGKPAQATS